jgi:hypothetical protein
MICAALPAQAHAVDTVFRAVLTGAGETPPVATPGSGWARVSFNSRDYSMTVRLAFADLVGTTTVAHIHCCTATPGSGTAGAATTTPSFVGFPSGVQAGRFVATYDMVDASSYSSGFLAAHGGSARDAYETFVHGVDEGYAYLNIHTTFKGSGEIAGFLTPIPEPGTWALMAAGVALVGAAAGRRARR